jgi:hypothetical protein
MRQLAPFLLILFLAAGRDQAAASEFLKYLEPRVEFVPNCAAPGNAVSIRTSLWTPLTAPCDCVATLTSTGDTLAARLGLVDCCQNFQFTAFYWGGGSQAVRVTRRAAGLIQCVDGWLTVGTCSRNPWTQGSGFSQGVQVVGTTPTSVEWRVTFDPKNYSAMPYTSFIGLLPVARITGTLVGTSTTRSVLPSELDSDKAYLDPLVVGSYFLDFNEQEMDPWANGDARSSLSGVRDPADRARSSYGGFRESYLVQDMFQESSVFARQTVTDDTLRALGLGSITIRYDVVAVVGDGPEAGTRLGYVELEFQRTVGQNARVVPVFSTLNAPPAPVEAAISQAMTAYFSGGKGFVWPLPVGVPVWGIRWGSCE